MLRIGDFARLAGVTVRALRHWQAQGLLQPGHVDAATGYRSYSIEQLETLGRIVALRDLGFPVRETRELLRGGPREIAAGLASRREQLEQDVRRQSQRLARLLALQRAVAKDAAGPELGVRLCAIAKSRALTLRGPGPAEPMFEEIEARAGRDRADSSPFLLVHSKRELEACVPVRAGCRLTGVRELEGAPLAGSIVYSGPYRQTAPLTKRMSAWLAESGLRECGPPREVYHRFGAAQRGYTLPQKRLASSADGYVTELLLPVQEPV